MKKKDESKAVDAAGELQAVLLSSVASSWLCWRWRVLFWVSIGFLFRVTSQGFIPLFSCGGGAEQWGEGRWGDTGTREAWPSSHWSCENSPRKCKASAWFCLGLAPQPPILLLHTWWAKRACLIHAHFHTSCLSQLHILGTRSRALTCDLVGSGQGALTLGSRNFWNFSFGKKFGLSQGS